MLAEDRGPGQGPASPKRQPNAGASVTRQALEISPRGREPTSYSTATLSAASWRSNVAAVFPGMTIRWPDERDAQASLQTRIFGDTRVTEIVSSPVRIACAPHAQADASYHLVVHLAGGGRYQHVGRNVTQRPGDMMLLDPNLPIAATFPSGVHAQVWDLPREALAPLLEQPRLAIGTRISGSEGLGAILAEYTRTLTQQVDRLDALTEGSLRMHLCGLVALALDTNRAVWQSRSQSYRAARRQQVLTYVETHIRDHHLTAERAARDLGMSRRWFHALFEQDGESFATWVARRRIGESRKLLDSPDYDHLSVAEIAFLQGFDSLSTFNRQFRAIYAMTPREARRNRDAPPHGAAR